MVGLFWCPELESFSFLSLRLTGPGPTCQVRINNLQTSAQLRKITYWRNATGLKNYFLSPETIFQFTCKHKCLRQIVWRPYKKRRKKETE